MDLTNSIEEIIAINNNVLGTNHVKVNELINAYLDSIFRGYEGREAIEDYNSDGNSLLDSCNYLSARKLITQVLQVLPLDIVDNYLRSKHEEYERKKQEAKEEGESDD